MSLPAFRLDEPHTVSDARRNLFAIINHVVEHDGEAVRIVSRAGSAIVVSSHAWHALTESVYVFADPVNSKFVHESIQSYLEGEPGSPVDPWSLEPDLSDLFRAYN